MKFSELGLGQTVLESISAMGFDEATPIQTQAIPVILENRDLIASAQTGTGKTAAFLLPVIEKLLRKPTLTNKVKVMVICPTRELAVQINQQMQGFSYFTDIASAAVYGGGDSNSFSDEKNAFINGVDIIIGTPGKLIAHGNMAYADFSEVECLILDEADRMLDMGFYDDIMKIVSKLPIERQNLLFSATMPPRIKEMAKKLLKNPAEITIALSKPAEKVRQLGFVVYENQKDPLIKYILTKRERKSVIVFCSRKNTVKDVTRMLKREGILADEIHSDLDQNVREETLNKFKSGSVKVLVATDIVARGIDVDNIELVINYDVPNDAESYVHRIGRTARADSDGAAYTFIGQDEQRNFADIERLIEAVVDKANIPNFLGDTPRYTGGDDKSKSRPNRNRKSGGNKRQFSKNKPSGSKKPAGENNTNGENNQSGENKKPDWKKKKRYFGKKKTNKPAGDSPAQ